MNKININRKKTAACVLCFILILISIIAVSPRAGDAATYETVNKTLDENRTAVIEISAIISGLSFIIAAVPGDSTTPVSNEISQFNTYLVVALAAIMFEKFMLPLLGLTVFRFIAPAALLFLCLFIVFEKRKLLEISINLAFLCVALIVTIPLGIKAGSIIDNSFGTEDLISELKTEMDDIDKLYNNDDSIKDSDKDNKETGEAASFLDGLYNRLTDTVEDVESSIKEAVTRNTGLIAEKTKAVISRTMDVIAVIIVANIIMPVLVILVMCWALKIAFTNIFLFVPGSL